MEVSSLEEDRVIQEIPVFLSKALADQLYLIQYILQPACLATSDDNILQAKIKPNQNKIQLTMEIDTDTRYDKRKGENLASTAAGANTDEDDDSDVEESTILNEYVMESSVAIPGSTKYTHYVMGVLRDGQVHLTPLKSIVQMKGKLDYLDEADKNSKKTGGIGEAGEPTKVTLRFSQARDHHMWKSRFGKGYNATKRKWEEEPWVELKYNEYDEDEYEKLVSGVKESDTPFYIISPKQYAEALIPKYTPISLERSDSKEKKSFKHLRVPIHQLKTQLPAEQLRHLMLHVQVLRFSQVLDYLKTKLKVSVDERGILRAIQAVAVLVQGCWVVKSDILYPADTASKLNGVSGEQMQKARDFILSQFTKSRILKRKEMCALTHLPMEEVTEILSRIAVVVPRKGWEFIPPYDSEFVANYEDVTQRQAIMWEMKAANRNRTLSLDLKPVICIPPRRRSGSGTRHVSFSSDLDSEAESSDGRQRKGKSSKAMPKQWTRR